MRLDCALVCIRLVCMSNQTILEIFLFFFSFQTFIFIKSKLPDLYYHLIFFYFFFFFFQMSRQFLNSPSFLLLLLLPSPPPPPPPSLLHRYSTLPGTLHNHDHVYNSLLLDVPLLLLNSHTAASANYCSATHVYARVASGTVT